MAAPSDAPDQLDAAGIARRIPHAGSMCLLDRLEHWTEQTIDCRATGHRDIDHPLRTKQGLLAPAAIEYAAQAMALHGALIAERAARAGGGEVSGPAPGFLASVRGVRLHVSRLDTVPGCLRIRAEQEAGEGNHRLYRFEVRAETGPLADGRAAVVLNTPLTR